MGILLARAPHRIAFVGMLQVVGVGENRLEMEVGEWVCAYSGSHLLVIPLLSTSFLAYSSDFGELVSS